MTHPKISVIIPNYCHAPYLDERIQSILRQTRQDFELIILDDCSPDNGASRNIIEKYRDNPHVTHIVYNEKNSGSTFLQWQKGFTLARGEYIWIAESDDKCEPTLLEELADALDHNVKLSVAFCRSVAFCEDKVIGPIGPQKLQEGPMPGKEFIHDFMRSGTGIVNASSAIFRKSALKGIRPVYTTMRGSGDRLFWTEMAEQGDVAFVEKPLNLFRTHTNNSTKKFGTTGVNQREDKVILDYILSKGYITPKEYEQCRKQYVRVHIFEMITDPALKQELYHVWEWNRWQQFKLRLEAWGRKIKKRTC